MYDVRKMRIINLACETIFIYWADEINFWRGLKSDRGS